MTLSLNGGLSRPFTQPSSDIFLQNTGIGNLFHLKSGNDPTQAAFFQTRNSSVTTSVSYRKSNVSSNLLTQIFLERPNLQWRLTKQTSNDSQRNTTSTSYQSRFAYDLSPRENKSVKPFGFLKRQKWVPSVVSDFKFNYYPDRFNFVVSDLSVRKSNTDISDLNNPLISSQQEDVEVVLSHGLELDWEWFTFFNFNYNLNIQRDFEEIASAFQGNNLFQSQEGGFLAKDFIFRGEPILPGEKGYTILFGENFRSQSFQSQLNPKLLDWFSHSVNFVSNYNHSRSRLFSVDTAQNNSDFFVVGQATNQIQFNFDWHFSKMFQNISKLSPESVWGKFFKDLHQTTQKYRIKSIGLNYSVRHNFQGEEFSLSQLNERGISNTELLAYQLGFIYDPSALLSWSRFRDEILIGNPRTNNPFDVFGSPLLDSNRITLAHNISREIDLKLPNLFLEPVSTTVGGSLGWSQNYTLHRDPFQQRNFDTTLIWPRYSVNFSVTRVNQWLLPVLKNSLKSLNLNSSYIFERSRSFNRFNQNSERESVSFNFNPLLRLTGETFSRIRFSNSFNTSFTRTTFRPKSLVDSTDVLSFRNFGNNASSVVLRFPIFGVQRLGLRTTRVWHVDNVFSIKKDLQTQKGFQFWKWYFRLKSNITLKGIFQAAWDRTIGDEFLLQGDLVELNSERIRDEFSFMIQPEVIYSFSDVDARFFLQYRYEKEFQTIDRDVEQFVQFSAVFTIRL